MKTVLLKVLRGTYRKIFNPKFEGWSWCTEEERIETNDIIRKLLLADEPCYIGRMGTVESAIVLNYITVHSNKNVMSKIFSYIFDDTRMPWWDKGLPFLQLQNNAGFFSDKFSVQEVERFSELYLRYIPTMDLCGRFSYPEKFFPFSDKCKMVQLETLYPFFVEHPWMEALEGEKVLVIHPFKDTILQQYEKRNKLFPQRSWLPDFDLRVIRAVQTIAGEKSIYKDWFEALDAMQEQILKEDFDVAIIGCGAYGLPLSGFVKSIGKKAIHMGGGTQLLFGIKGRRWEKDYENPCYRDLFNQYWVYPNEKECPNGAKKVESGCYW